MKKTLLLLFAAFALLACQNDQDDQLNLTVLEGTWLLTEVLFDPGDGSGEFRKIDSERQMSLAPDNTYTTNYDVCQAIEEGEKFSGSFERIDAQEFLIPCAGSLLNSVQGRLEDGYLVLYYPCDEPCAYKFRKISDFRG
jgi:hypothetical protein